MLSALSLPKNSISSNVGLATRFRRRQRVACTDWRCHFRHCERSSTFPIALGVRSARDGSGW